MNDDDDDYDETDELIALEEDEGDNDPDLIQLYEDTRPTAPPARVGRSYHQPGRDPHVFPLGGEVL